jgi:hypothetical protein
VDRNGPTSTGYLMVGLTLLVLGFLTMFSIGVAVFTVGVVHLALYPVRHRAEIHRPVMLGVIAFWLGFGLVAPMWCTQTAGATVDAWCQSAIGIRYPAESPSYLPGLAAGIGAATVVAGLSRILERRRLPGSSSTA